MVESMVHVRGIDDLSRTDMDSYKFSIVGKWMVNVNVSSRV